MCKIKLVINCFFLFLFSQGFAEEKFVLFTPPKCGTHLILRVLENMLGKEADCHLAELGSMKDILQMAHQATQNNQFVVAHNFSEEALYRLVNQGYKVVFLLRDPRDQLVSMFYWIKEGQWNWLPAAKIENQNALISELITGKKFGWKCYENCIGERLLRLGALDPEAVYLVRFEKLIGKAGGGSQQEQIAEIRGLAAFLKISISSEDALAIGEQSYGNTWTFRSGKIGGWREVFTKKQKSLYNEWYGNLLISLGYEKDFNW